MPYTSRMDLAGLLWLSSCQAAQTTISKIAGTRTSRGETWMTIGTMACSLIPTSKLLVLRTIPAATIQGPNAQSMTNLSARSSLRDKCSLKSHSVLRKQMTKTALNLTSRSSLVAKLSSEAKTWLKSLTCH